MACSECLLLVFDDSGAINGKTIVFGDLNAKAAFDS